MGPEDEASGTLREGAPACYGGGAEPPVGGALFRDRPQDGRQDAGVSGSAADHGRSGRTYSRKLAGFTEIIDRILAEDRKVHAKQRHTAQRIFERLQQEHGFKGGRTIVREYVSEARQRSREVFIPLSHRPGHAQADFGEADAIIAGKRVRFHYFCMDLPHIGCVFCQSLSGRGGRSVLRWACRGV